MKIKQDKEPFRPITIVLETEAEANAFWAICDKANESGSLIGPEKELAIEISNKFSLGGLKL